MSLNGRMIQKMWCIYTMEYYSAIRNNTFMKFLDKWIELENIIKWGSPVSKEGARKGEII